MNPRIAVVLLLVAGACGASHNDPAGSAEPSVAPIVSTSRPTIVSSSRPTTEPARACTTRDLHGDVVWDAGFVATGGTSVDTRTGGLEMSGQLNVWNVSASACVLPGRFTVRLVGATGHELAVPSVERDFGLSGFDWKGPLAPGALAAAPMSWEPSWCGPAPGPTAVVAVSFTPGDVPLRAPVTVSHPKFGDAPSCLRDVPASVLVAAPFAQRQPGERRP